MLAGRVWLDKVRRYLPELIYGASDGIVTTLAIVAGVVGASLSANVILILGFANLFADGISMGASNVLSERSKIESTPTLGEALPKGIATFTGFLLAGLVPLVAYLVPDPGVDRFVLAVVMAAITLFVVGASRSFVMKRGFLAAGIEMLSIGLAAAAIAYVVGQLGSYLVNGSL